MAVQWNDNALRYGAVSRALHWGMALLFLWQFTGMATKYVLGRTPVTAFFVGTHVSVGSLLFLLILIRAVWGLSQLRHRPPHEPGPLGKLAWLGHLVLYLLMLIVPVLAVLRALGSGRGYSVFGVQIAAATGETIPWMVAPASLLHKPLAWILLVLIAGHIAFAITHRVVWKDDILARMAGPGRPQTGSPPARG